MTTFPNVRPHTTRSLRGAAGARRRTRLLMLAAVALSPALGACGAGGGEAAAGSGVEEGAAVRRTPSSDSTAPGSMASMPAGPASGTPPSPAGTAPADTSRAGSGDKNAADAGAGSDAGPWSSPPLWSEGAAGATLVDVRTAAHAAFDRLVFEFEGGVPAYSVERLDGPARECGSGRPVDVAAPAGLRVRFQATSAHTDAGQPTVGNRSRQPALDRLRTLRMTCDFEGVVAWAAGLAAAPKVRILQLSSPPRLVVDVR